MTESVELLIDAEFSRDQLYELYSSVGWVAYTASLDDLERAVANSTCVQRVFWTYSDSR